MVDSTSKPTSARPGSTRPQGGSVDGLWSPQSSGIAPRGRQKSALLAPHYNGDWTDGIHESAEGTPMVGCVPVADLSCVYQPIVDLQTGKLFAYEVLARCRVPGLTNPELLFKRAAAERFAGLLGRTLRTMGAAKCRGVPLFLNVHPAELGDRWVVQPDDPMYQHDDDVFVEITESVAFSRHNLCVSMLREICSRGGVHLVVDDLGAGYSNLKRIADLEPAVVKLDRELIIDLDKHKRAQLLVRAVVRMCVDLGARVVAEGLETWDEVRAVRDAGCHYGQGYALGRPVPDLAEPIWKL